MGKKLIETEDGILVEVEVARESVEEISGGFAQRVGETFDCVHPLLVKSCRPIVKAWKELNQEMKVEQAEVELGLSFTGEGNLYITKATTSANLKIKLVLSPDTGEK
ncbi:MAG: CU044_2847 family protein [Microcystaceae cyanobacterium]